MKDLIIVAIVLVSKLQSCAAGRMIHLILVPQNKCVLNGKATTELDDLELRWLAQSAMVLRSRSNSYTMEIPWAHQRWRTWADARQGVPSFPVQGASSGAVRVAPQ